MNLRSVKIVRAAWPKAICVTNKEYLEVCLTVNGHNLNHSAYWIYDSDFPGAIGWGSDIKSAWKHAEEWVNSEMMRKLES